MSPVYIVLIVLACLLVVFVTILLILMPRKVYFTALFSKAYLSAFRLISMKMRKIDVNTIVDAYILSKRAKFGILLSELETIAVSGGHPKRVVEGVIAARSAKLDIDFEFSKAIDIAGRDVLEVVRECVNPKILEVPLVTSAAQDNVEVNVKFSLTLKLKLSNFLKGVTEETIVARAIESVVTKIANTPKAAFLVSKPQLIDRAVFDANIDEDAQYELVSADVIHIDLGKDRNLYAEKEQIEKNRILTANQLEQRRLTALAVEQEMKAKSEEMRAKVVANEAEIPKAIIQAIQEGKIKDVVDYYKMQNLQADTEMRRQFVNKYPNSED